MPSQTVESGAAPVRFAVVGCGNIARTHAGALARLAAAEPPLVEIAACVDPRPERAKALAAAHGGVAMSWREALADPSIDAVTICTPSGTHAELGLEALAAGKHVVVEKPMDASLAAARALTEAAERAGRVVSVISQHRFDAATEYAQGVMARGELGTIITVDARVPWLRPQEYYDADAWRGTWAQDGGGALINQGIHTVDLMLLLAGPVRRVQAAAATRVRDIEVEDTVCAVLQFASGAVGTLMASTATAPGFPARLAVNGDAGALAIEGDAIVLDIRADGSSNEIALPRADAVAVAGRGSRSVARPSEAESAGAWGSAHEAQLRDVVQAIHDGGAVRSGAQEGLDALTLVDAVYRAARTGAAVELPAK